MLQENMICLRKRIGKLNAGLPFRGQYSHHSYMMNKIFYSFPNSTATNMSLVSPELKILHEGFALMQNICREHTPYG